jgi:lipopolysaccharide/colanic/teichoic acid biosynthesis glycosyltransferase
MKRLFDILLSATALLVLSPILVLVILLIRLESKGAAIYTSNRVGQGYKIFKLYKFRTMFQDADQQLKQFMSLNQYEVTEDEHEDECSECAKLGHACSTMLYDGENQICERLYLKKKSKEKQQAFIKLQDDPRITPIGKFLRKTSIDEIPQLFNVLKGDMSLVGNRPLPLYEAEKLTYDEAVLRFEAPAGLTGLWQVEKRGKKGSMSAAERIGLDNLYAARHSFLFDMKLIFRTIPALFQEENV